MHYMMLCAYTTAQLAGCFAMKLLHPVLQDMLRVVALIKPNVIATLLL